MSNYIRSAWFHLSDPRKVALSLSLALFALALIGQGGVVSACPAGDAGAG